MSALELTIFDSVTLIPQCILFAWYNTCVVKLKKPWVYIISYVILVPMVVFLGDMNLFGRTVRTWLTYIIYIFLLCIFAQKNNRIFAIIVSFTNTMLTAICEAIGIAWYLIVTGDYEYNIFSQPRQLLLGRAVFCGIYVIIGNLLCYFWRKGKRVYERRLSNVFVPWLMLQYVCLQIVVGQNHMRVLNNLWNLSLCVLGSLVCILVNVGIYFYLLELDRVMEETCRQEQMVLQMKNQKSREHEIEGDIKKAENIKSNILTGIGEARSKLLEADKKGSFESLQEIVKQIDEEAVFCRNRVVNALLLTKYVSCEEESIQLVTKLDLDNEIEKDTGIQNVDLCVIVGNLLDNAIRACKKKNVRNECSKGMDGIAENASVNMAGDNMLDSKAYIRLAARKKGKYLVFHQENTTYGEMENRREGLLSEHGLGLEILERVARKYHGYIEIQQEKEVFHTYVMLKMQNKTT